MNNKEIGKHLENIVKKVMKHWSKFKKINKKEFEKGLDIIIESISKITDIPAEQIAIHTNSVIEEFPDDYGKLPDKIAGHEAIISTLYLKYLKKLDCL